ncbi:F0F1 ATP synthase subunit A [Acidimangrovimonas sediminis]|uniref:F0F1 ATP synthase subunit A n=1 Tax=Acidimangrovimonas sediminis TaxID=2056283 RepID=UPI000C7FF416|nr:F0F1 ATP synthase subunit A [Acidimangrovimonas sediminis]
MESPFGAQVLFRVGPVPISPAVATTWGIMALLTLVSWLALRRATPDGGPVQTALEIVVETIEDQIRAILQRDPGRYLPLLGTLFLFLVTANLVPALPGLRAPTSRIETPVALGLIVFLSIHWFGLRETGVAGYLGHFLRPNPLLLPLTLLSEITRILSLMVRLFGNMMSHELILAILVYLAGFVLPVPFMVLGLLIGVIQAYIFTILATVYIGAAVGAVDS